ncbi:hypothetical protein M9Y10_005985 [Tritrichomonas musculus]|uniref:EF-hand domain-containing protein n=1 Tax=Tritrichomonas musculus TaxID=1915356 RepID=A0ABR2JD07_9EUKA
MTSKRLKSIRLPPQQQPKTILSYTASIVSNNVDDKLREFMVNYCVEDSTFAIYEKVVPNSGFPGGKFLKETKAINPLTNKPYKPEEVEVGKDIVVNGWKFHLNIASEGTLKTIEAKSGTIFTNSSISHIILPLRQKIGKRGSESYERMHCAFMEYDTRKRGKVTQEQMRDVLVNKLNTNIGEQELVILFRKYQFAGADLFQYEQFLSDNF